MINRLRGRAGVCLIWLITRGIVIGYALTPHAIHRATGPNRDVSLYEYWTKLIADGSFPAHDVRWQYPPLAGPVLGLARLFPGDYFHGFVFLSLLIDLVVLLLLLRSKDRLAGAWVWTLGLFMLGSTTYLRYDVLVTLPAVAALLALPRERLFGALAAIGALMKIWPILLMLALPRDRRLFRAGAVFAGVCAVVLGLGELYASNMWSFVHNQGGRGMEIEAVAATPFQIARVFGWHASARYRYGSMQVVAPAADNVAAWCIFATLIGLALVAYAAWRRSPATWTPAIGCDIALAAVLVSVVTSRVLSPQYLIWLIGVGAVCLTRADTRMRLPVLMIVLAVPLTFLNFPWLWHHLLTANALNVAILTARNALLLAATLLAIKRIWPTTGRRARAKTPEQKAVTTA